jgi:hypothetical protein
MGNPQPSSVLYGERFIDYKVVGASLKYSQALMETLQDNIVFISNTEFSRLKKKINPQALGHIST